MIPTTEQFWLPFEIFNLKFVYLHIVWIILSIVILCLHLYKKKQSTNAVLKLFLSLTFIFNGVFFFMINTQSAFSKFFYGSLFLAVGLSFFVDLFVNKINFKFPDSTPIRIFTVIGLILVYIYPFFGMLLGRNFPHLCMPMNACPSTVFATTLVTAAVPKTSRLTLILLLPWGLLALPKALGLYGCYEDAILFLAGVYGLIILILFWKKIKLNA